MFDSLSQREKNSDIIVVCEVFSLNGVTGYCYSIDIEKNNSKHVYIFKSVTCDVHIGSY